ncbi:hypothetical protein ASG69_19345 [Rhodococcus sp. Leaf225]|nr:hypothetical protein ASG69_19345 [Rhodococcus sp. Leaf225]KQU48939.1 hypothetical protein ASH03_03810 [Rhodococcus sp. Leaf258]
MGEPMSARDAVNYFFESDRTPGTIVHGVVVDAGRSSRSVRTHADAVDFAAGILDTHPLFTRRLQTVTGHLAFPHWVDCAVDVGDHVFVHPAPAVGGHEFLCRRVIDASRTPMNFEVPAWQLHFVTGLRGVTGVPDGGTVLLVKLHHSAIDGMGTAALVHRLLAPAGSDTSTYADDQFRRTRSTVPTIGSALRALPRDAARLIGAVGTSVVATRRPGSPARPAGHKYPATRFNRNTPPDMTFGLTWFDLDRVRAVKARVPGATVNDVVMTMVSLAVSSYLGDEMPRDTLGASFPVNIRAIAEDETANRLSIAVADLATDVRDPMARLQAISTATASSKAELVARTRDLPTHPVFSAPAPLLAGLAAVMPRRPARPDTTPTNLMVSNIPYGPDPMELLGAPVVGVFAPLPVVEGVQLAHVVVSSGRRMCLTAVSHRDLMPDVSRYIACLDDALDQLFRASTGRNLAAV